MPTVMFYLLLSWSLPNFIWPFGTWLQRRRCRANNKNRGRYVYGDVKFSGTVGIRRDQWLTVRCLTSNVVICLLRLLSKPCHTKDTRHNTFNLQYRQTADIIQGLTSANRFTTSMISQKKTVWRHALASSWREDSSRSDRQIKRKE